MTPAQRFVLIIVSVFVGCAFLAGIQKRYLEYKLKKSFMKDQKEHLQGQIDEQVSQFFSLRPPVKPGKDEDSKEE